MTAKGKKRKRTRGKPLRKDWQMNNQKIMEVYMKLAARKRRAPTIIEIAEASGYRRQTVSEHLEYITLTEVLPSAKLYAHKVINGIAKAAAAGDAAAARLYFQLVFGWTDKSEGSFALPPGSINVTIIEAPKDQLESAQIVEPSPSQEVTDAEVTIVES